MQLRQSTRREQFLAAFYSMPLWETWDTTDVVVMARADGKVHSAVRHHCKPIPRRLRREMARVRVRNERRHH